jgi:hypothetical protein
MVGVSHVGGSVDISRSHSPATTAAAAATSAADISSTKAVLGIVIGTTLGGDLRFALRHPSARGEAQNGKGDNDDHFHRNYPFQ